MNKRDNFVQYAREQARLSDNEIENVEMEFQRFCERFSLSWRMAATLLSSLSWALIEDRENAPKKFPFGNGE